MHENVGGLGYGPRLVVRSIKKINKGEEVTVAYTDLLQPKVHASNYYYYYYYYYYYFIFHALFITKSTILPCTQVYIIR